MDPRRLKQIEETVTWRHEQSLRILEGGENYDGADGARYINELCKICKELISALSNPPQQDQ